MKTALIITALLFGTFTFSSLKAQPSGYRIFGQLTTVENKTYKGYITWNGNKRWWIDYFEATKKDNPYTSYFKDRNDIYFINNNNRSSKPPVHVFMCRFGNISKIRLIATNMIELQVKDGNFIELKKGGNDIGSTVQLYDGIATYDFKWEQISEVSFSAPDSTFIASPELPITGIARSTQGMYKGVVNYSKKNTLNSEITGWSISSKISIPFRDILQIQRANSTLTLKLGNGNETKLRSASDFSYAEGPLTIHMPNIGSVSIPWIKFEQLELIPLKAVDLLTYDDFKTPNRLHGEVLLRNGKKLKGTIAYDLDESMDFEILDGKNDDISYRIPFKYVQSVEPKNYKYSFITLRNGSTLSLGDSPDVNEANSGLLIYPENDIPVYIPWKEVQLITFQ